MPSPHLIGEAPSERGDRFWQFPLSGPPARALCEMAGFPPDPESDGPGRWTWALYERFECRNLIPRYANATPWSAPYARMCAQELIFSIEDGAGGGRLVLVALGRRVQEALGTPRRYWDWVERAGRWEVTLPHPSGRNRVLNDPAARERSGECLRAALELMGAKV